MKIEQKLETLVGHRFPNTKLVQRKLAELGFPNASVSEDSSPIARNDFELVCSLFPNSKEGDYGDFTLFYLKDRNNQYYITEVNPWGI